MQHEKLLDNIQKSLTATPSKPDFNKTALGSNQELLSKLGQSHPMPDNIQAKMEQALGSDFSSVELYESPVVEQNGALAAASGNKVAFAPGKLNFDTSAGLELLGHELSHVASQSRGEVHGHGFLNDSSLEHKADMDGFRAAHSVFDASTSETIAPLSMGMSNLSSGAPIQAKKLSEEEKAQKNARLKQIANVIDRRKGNRHRSTSPKIEEWEIEEFHRIQREHSTNASHFDHALSSIKEAGGDDRSAYIKALANFQRARDSTNFRENLIDPTKITSWDNSEYYNQVSNLDNRDVEEIFHQKAQLGRLLLAERNRMMQKKGLSEADATYMTKHSELGQKMRALNSILTEENIYWFKADPIMAHYNNLLNQEEFADDARDISTGMSIAGSKDEVASPWLDEMVSANTSRRDQIKLAAEARNHAFANKYKRPKEPGFFKRLFGFK